MNENILISVYIHRNNNCTCWNSITSLSDTDLPGSNLCVCVFIDLKKEQNTHKATLFLSINDVKFVTKY